MPPLSMIPERARESLTQLALSEGLFFLGVVALDVGDDYARFERWLSSARHGTMDYLARHQELRRDPSLLLPGARRALLFGLPYDLGDRLDQPEPRVAQYARFPDYHRRFRRKLELVAETLDELAPDAELPLQQRILVDSAPVLERALAAKAAEGFIGKNTCWIHPRYGSWFLLGEILTSWGLPLDASVALPLDRKTKRGGCGPCTLCQVHCPTGALHTDYSLDPSLCLSYWTIEHRGPIPERFWPHLARYYFGCDLCQLACPYNRKGERIVLPADWNPRTLPSLFDTAVMTQAEYEVWFGGTPLTRAKRGGLRRNALIALHVTGDPRCEEAMARAREDAEEPVGETLRQLDAVRGA